MYTPSFIKRENQYSPGGEYMLRGEEYVGYYNVTIQGPYTGRVFDPKEFPLFPLKTVFNKESQTYSNLADGQGYITDLEFDDPLYSIIEPSIEDIKRGYFLRYFIQQRNDKRARIRELDKKQYDTVFDATAGINPNLYKSVILRWKIAGPEFDKKDGDIIIKPGVRDTNQRTLLEKEHLMTGIFALLRNRLAQYSPYAIDGRKSNTDLKL